MTEGQMTDQIAAVLSEGIRATIQDKAPDAFRDAAIEAYRIRTGGRALSEDDAIINHVFPSDVQQTVALGLTLADSDKEKASVILKGATTSVLGRLSAVPAEHLQKDGRERRRGWRFWRKE
ncbi:MAG: hypothetical protein CME26_04565 [Gemmatimonadetes bacterium]|nr:hypothetical protein [Gemmatimonadota bacterium]